jgi:hypothetical protein
MAHFPTLKTGAIAQYPAGRAQCFATHIVRFLDGSEQRYRDFSKSRGRWTIALDMLDDTELEVLAAFFAQNQGRYGSFGFTDPWDGMEYPDCSFEQDTHELSLQAEMRSRTTLIIRENNC